jgi:hypothetical protein
MPEPREITMLLDLEREQEQRFVSCLDPAERESARDTLAHVIGAKWRMCDALAALRAGGEPDPSHDRDEVVRAYAGQEFASLEADAARVADALGAEVEALDAGTLASSPGWIGEATLADEIVQQCATHGMVIVFEGICERGGADDARRAQELFVESLPADMSALQRSRALYNLACLDVRTGREDDAVAALTHALRLRPALAKQITNDPDLEPVRDRVLT